MNMLICEGSITQSSGDLICSTGWITQLASLPFDASQIDPLLATSLLTGGFLISLVPFATAFGISSLLKAIRSF